MTTVFAFSLLSEHVWQQHPGATMRFRVFEGSPVVEVLLPRTSFPDQLATYTWEDGAVEPDSDGPLTRSSFETYCGETSEEVFQALYALRNQASEQPNAQLTSQEEDELELYARHRHAAWMNCVVDATLAPESIKVPRLDWEKIEYASHIFRRRLAREDLVQSLQAATL